MKNPKAFPTKNMLFNTLTNNIEVVEHGGMTLLDYFAGQYLQGISSNQKESKSLISIANERKVKFVDQLARHCYEVAKAMLKKREQL